MTPPQIARAVHCQALLTVSSAAYLIAHLEACATCRVEGLAYCPEVHEIIELLRADRLHDLATVPVE